jgi:hypothetical protein
MIESLKAFVKAIVKVFGDWYLRAPNETNIGRLYNWRVAWISRDVREH